MVNQGPGAIDGRMDGGDMVQMRRSGTYLWEREQRLPQLALSQP